ncbi:glutamate mutase L [Candidatus Bathyarchaeota archaeon]|nr:glutamate mutase L [Candidatus Bathyarchaeota archaeon]
MATLSRKTKEIQYILATDVGSTTTKARYFKKTGGEYRYVVSGEAPTTVEAPFEDVTMGVLNAVREVEELTGRSILSKGGAGIILGEKDRGVDIYVTTSSAGGGLQMMCTGLIKSMTAESAERAALGAGAIVMDTIAIDDGRKDYHKIRRIRSLRPDMILIAGGTDGGDRTHILQTVELIKASEPKARLGANYELPVVYAGNKAVRKEVTEIIGKEVSLEIVDNIRPTLAVEYIEPSRQAIHLLFMEHVMSHAPGYDKLMTWTDVPIMPTPAGEGMMVQLIAKTFNTNTIGVGLGGATTNIYSIVEGKFVRTVSANLGMSYSICNVMKEAKIENIARWIPFELDERNLRNRLRNKMIRPTTIPQSTQGLIIEHSVAREALRLGLKHHKTLARGLKGIKIERTVGDLFDQAQQETYIDLLKINIVVGTGGLLSHAPRRVQSLLVLTDGFSVEGVTRLFQASVFMMPHLGVLSTVQEKIAWEIFDKDCLLRLGTVIAPKGTAKPGEDVISVTLEMPDGKTLNEKLRFGEIKRIPLAEGEEAKATITPRRGFNVGAGSGRKLETSIMGGTVGIVIDARGRPLQLPKDDNERMTKLIEWFTALKLYPEEVLKTFHDNL